MPSTTPTVGPKPLWGIGSFTWFSWAYCPLSLPTNSLFKGKSNVSREDSYEAHRVRAAADGQWPDVAEDWEAGLQLSSILGEKGICLELMCQCEREKRCAKWASDLPLTEVSGVCRVLGILMLVLFLFWTSKALCFEMKTLVWAIDSLFFNYCCLFPNSLLYLPPVISAG